MPRTPEQVAGWAKNQKDRRTNGWRGYCLKFSRMAAGAPGGTYDAVTAAGVTRFQTRNRLHVDSMLNEVTLAAINVSPGKRARQLELALERTAMTDRDLNLDDGLGELIECGQQPGLHQTHADRFAERILGFEEIARAFFEIFGLS